MDNTKDTQELNIDELLEELSKPVNIQASESENIYIQIINLFDNIEFKEDYQNVDEYETFEFDNIDLDELSLVPVKNTFLVSSRQLSKFYLFRKRLKIACYKLFVKIPKLVFGME